MEIIDLQMKKNKKAFVATTFDGENVILSPEAIVKFKICVGQVDDAIWDTACFESDCYYALNKSMNWLTASYRSESELKKYLKERKYNNKVAEFVINKLKEYKFLSDENLAKNFVEYGQNKMGIFKLRQKMLLKGISKDIIDDALKDVGEQDDICYEFAIKKLKNMERTKENMAKVNRYLLSKGFDYETIKRTFNKLNVSEEEL